MQCTTAACNTLALGGANVTEANINAALASAPTQTYVFIPAGTYSITIGSGFQIPDQVELRGAGADKTIIVGLKNGAGLGCNGLRAAIALCGSYSAPNFEENFATWTAGFAQGATSITASNSTNITAGRTLITLDQQDETTDTGNIWNCLGNEAACGGGTGSFARTDHTCAVGVSPFSGYCSQEQQVLVTACISDSIKI